MKETKRFEAAVLGTGLASLVAGYILKQYKIQFTYVELHTEYSCMDNLEAYLNKLEKDWTYENSKDGPEKVKEQICDCMRSVGIDPEVPMSEQDENRFMVRLEYELKDELDATRKIRKLVKHSDYYQATELTAEEEAWTDNYLELDALIVQDDMWKAGLYAEAVFAEKQMRLEAYMKQLRIQEGRKEPRKMVYITHSKSWFYAKERVQQFAMMQGVAPVNPFMNFGYYLDQRIDKDEIVASCHQMIRSSEELWVFGPISEAMLTDIVVAVMEGKSLRFFSISENPEEIKELEMEKIIFEREVHAGQIHKSDLLNFIRSTAPRTQEYKQMTLFG